MKYSDQKKKMKMANGGLPEDINMGNIQGRLRNLGTQLRGSLDFMDDITDAEILQNVLNSRQAQNFLTQIGNVSIPKSKAIRKAGSIRGPRPPRMD
jgi:hypothetical protein